MPGLRCSSHQKSINDAMTIFLEWFSWTIWFQVHARKKKIFQFSILGNFFCIGFQFIYALALNSHTFVKWKYFPFWANFSKMPVLNLGIKIDGCCSEICFSSYFPNYETMFQISRSLNEMNHEMAQKAGSFFKLAGMYRIFLVTNWLE